MVRKAHRGAQMKPLRNLVRDFIGQMAKGGTPADQAEAKELLARINDDQPRFAAAQPEKTKKGARK